MSERARKKLDRRDAGALAVLLVLTCLFGPYLWGWLRLACADSLSSHLPLIPLISIYLIWTQREPRLTHRRHPDILTAVIFVSAAVLCLVISRVYIRPMAGLSRADALALPMLSYVFFLYAGVAIFYGRYAFKKYLFPLFFLLLMVPMPSVMEARWSTFLELASAEAFHLLLVVTRNPFFRDGIVFHLPGLTLNVAPECSGIRSTLVLFITSLLLAHLVLPRPWQKVVLVLLVLPIGIARNAFRILAIAMLTIHIDKGVIEGPLHHRGGPLFFMLALAVLFAAAFGLLAAEKWWRRDRAKTGSRETAVSRENEETTDD